mmetsp:Transcript_10514/g.35154  ORF Transcript_10514/g.35154 Transcript_10514/m.35154 type:complete len:84 (-) Transcript_10514:26-277(-)
MTFFAEVFLEKFDVRQGNHKRRVTNMFQQVGSGILSKTGKDVPLINILEYKENDCLNFEAEIGSALVSIDEYLMVMMLQLQEG